MAVTDAEKKTRGGISAFVVGKSDEGVSFGTPEKKLGIRWFAHTRGVPRQGPPPRRPDDRRGGHRLCHRDEDPRPHLCHHRAQAVGVAQAALDYALDYAKERQQFGKPIADFQGLQFMLAEWA